MLRYYIESIRLEDGIPQGLEWHQARLERTYSALWHGPCHIDLGAHLPSHSPLGRAKWRVVYGQAGVVETSVEAYTPRVVQTLRLVHDDAIDYTHKAQDRHALDACWRQRADADDVLIVRHGLLTDTSIANVALGDGTHWYTPTTPLLAGTCRAQLLQAGRMVCAPLRAEDLERFPLIALFNALLPLGEVVLPTSAIRL